MSDTTSRVSLYKPAGGENVNVTTDLNNNLDKIDTNLNFRVVANAAARNAVSPFWEGLNVRETDTGKLYVSNGSSPLSGSWDQIATSDTYVSASNIQAGASGTTVFNLRVDEEATNRYEVRGDGRISWGSGGGSAVDTNLYRSAANTLATDDALSVGSNLSVAGSAAVAGAMTVGGIGFPRFAYRTTDTTRTSTTTMANDEAIFMALDANSVYLVEMSLRFSAINAAKVQVDWEVPTNATGNRSVLGPGSSANETSMDNVSGRFGVHNPPSDITYGTRNSSSQFAVVETGILTTVDAGTLYMRWSQASSNATGSTCHAGSWMRVTKLS